MSNNIHALHVRKLHDFRLSLAELKRRRRWADIEEEGEKTIVTFEEVEIAEIKGRQEGDSLIVEEMEFGGIYSGIFWVEQFIPFLERHSTGMANLLVVWESGHAEEVIVAYGEIGENDLTAAEHISSVSVSIEVLRSLAERANQATTIGVSGRHAGKVEILEDDYRSLCSILVDIAFELDDLLRKHTEKQDADR